MKVAVEEHEELEVVEVEGSEDVGELEPEVELPSSSFLTSSSICFTILLSVARSSEAFLTLFVISGVISAGSSGISSIILLATGPTQLSASLAIFAAVFRAPFPTLAALEARLPIASKRPLFFRDPEQDDCSELKPTLER